MKDDSLEFLGGAALFLVALISVVFLVTEPLSWRDCNVYGEESGLTTEYRFLSRCFVTVDGETLPLSDYREIRKARALAESGLTALAE